MITIYHWREDSIKTRIETCLPGYHQSDFYNWREDSIKTRIETQGSSGRKSKYHFIEEKIPLKQGLKLIINICMGRIGYIEEKIPLKQGLKPAVILAIVPSVSNWREDSIKTRIETSYRVVNKYGAGNWREDSIKTRIETNKDMNVIGIPIIEEKIPLKQGLKPSIRPGINPCTGNWREDSIKTRIETRRISSETKIFLYWREDSIKTRIETYICWHPCNFDLVIEEKIPLKQGLKLENMRDIEVEAKRLKRRFH